MNKILNENKTEILNDWKNGMKNQDIANKYKLTAKQVSNFIYRNGERRERVPSSFSIPSSRRDQTTYEIAKISNSDINKMNIDELNDLNKSMKKIVKRDLKKLEKIGGSAAFFQVERNIEKYDDKYLTSGETSKNIYFDNYENLYGARKQFYLLKKYLTEYQTGSLRGEKKRRREELERISSLSNNKDNNKKNIENKVDNKDFWETYRRLTSQINPRYIKQTIKQKDYFFGSESIQQFLYNVMEDNIDVDEDYLLKYAEDVAEKSYIAEQEEEEEEEERQKRAINAKIKNDTFKLKVKWIDEEDEEDGILPF